MIGQRSIGVTTFLLTVAAGVGTTDFAAGAERATPAPTIKIGMAGSLFRDMPAPLVNAFMGPFRALMESQTGLRGDLVHGGDALTLGADLNLDKVQLAVFHGFEFAWAQKKFPGLRALMIAVNQQQLLYAHVLVRKDSTAAALGDLKGKSLALPNHTREHCRLYLERSCPASCKNLHHYFTEITKPGCVEEGLDDVVDGRVQAVVVDGVSLDCYKKRKPGRFAKLKEINKSAAFPAAVVAYHAGAVDEATLLRFQKGMMNANKTAFGRQLLTFWQMTGFEQIPVDYDQLLAEIVKIYPPPAKSKPVK